MRLAHYLVRISLMLIGLVFYSAGICYAHDARPISITISEQSLNSFIIKTLVPASLTIEQIPVVVLPQYCTVNDLNDVVTPNLAGTAWLRFQNYTCQRSLSESIVSLVFPKGNPSLSSLIQLTLLNGDHYNAMLKPGVYDWQIPRQRLWYQLIVDFSLFGIEHISIGYDHLLFVLLLFILAKNAKQLIAIITGFTLAHSITLTAAAFQWLLLPSAVVEASIALSIVFLASELLMNNPNSWTIKYPIIMSAAIGLVHGFGFASILADLGFVESESVYALLFFNLGVEIGQLCFIAILLILTKPIIRYTDKFHQTLERQLVCLTGVIGAMWFFERLSAF